jgi:hypothetical protein
MSEPTTTPSRRTASEAGEDRLDQGGRLAQLVGLDGSREHLDGDDGFALLSDYSEREARQPARCGVAFEG